MKCLTALAAAMVLTPAGQAAAQQFDPLQVPTLQSTVRPSPLHSPVYIAPLKAPRPLPPLPGTLLPQPDTIPGTEPPARVPPIPPPSALE